MIIEKDINAVVESIRELYKNKELALFVINEDECIVDLAIYDDFKRDGKLGKLLAGNHLRYTEITIPNITKEDLDLIKSKLEKSGIKESNLYEYKLDKEMECEI